ncbi:MAG: anti-sigma regulatory factor [Pseudanabaena sp. CAN_BIN31]|nr:anti-sigma regulatory factor [Pseudanabaena sp. CAN_BIN31]
MAQTISLRVNTDLNELAKVLDWYEKLNHDAMSKIDWWRCKTALAEVFTNAVRHAHKNMPQEMPIDLEATLTENTLEMKVFDFGAGFDLSGKLSDFDDVDINALGGRGLDLISQIVDVFSYERVAGDRNCMLMIKHYSPVP